MSMRKIIHIDMDSFYASVEMRDRPELMTKPIAVGGNRDRRGVLCTCNYEARKYGIHSAMPTAHALRLCPELVVLPVDMPKYRLISEGIREIFKTYTDQVEPLSLDEAFLDVTNSSHYAGSATWIAEAIRKRIFDEFNLTASAGVAPNKFLAKIASDWRKPNGLYVILPNQVADFVKLLPIEKISGVGKVTAAKLHALQIKTCADLQKFPLDLLLRHFGIWGTRLHELSFGIDKKPVEPNRIRKSLSVETTFFQDIIQLDQACSEIEQLFLQLKKRLERYADLPLLKQFVKVKFNNFTRTTVERHCDNLTPAIFMQLFQEGYDRKTLPIRLIGIGVQFDIHPPQNIQQMDLGLADN